MKNRVKTAIIIFTRVPERGQTKTRMMPFLTPEECADLHKNFIRDIYANSKNCNVDILVFYTLKGQNNELEELLDDQTLLFPQCGGDIGERMQQAFATAFHMGYESCVLIGTDVPQITETIIIRALEGLKNSDVVIHPTIDGGYYLIGMKQEHPSIWHVEHYGTDTVMEDTLRHLKEQDLCVTIGPMYRDMDTKEDLMELYKELGTADEIICPYTWSYLNVTLAYKMKEKG